MQRAPSSSLFPYTTLFRSNCVAGGPELNHKVRADRREGFLVLGRERIPSFASNPGCVGRPPGTICESKTCIRIEGNAGTVAYGPISKLSADLGVSKARPGV